MTAPPDNEIACKILHAAARLFAQKGYADTSTREIVEAAGVTKPMLYYYFRSKEGLCRTMLDRFLGPFHRRLRTIVETESDPRAQVEELVWAHFDFCRRESDFARLYYALFFGPDAQSAGFELSERNRVGHQAVLRCADNAVRSRLVRPGCEQSFAMAIHGMINIWVIAALKGGTELTRDLAIAVVEYLLRGFGNGEREGR